LATKATEFGKITQNKIYAVQSYSRSKSYSGWDLCTWRSPNDHNCLRVWTCFFVNRAVISELPTTT